MHDSLQEELKLFEKELSILLVRFMKICDRVETQGGQVPSLPEAVAKAKPAAPAAPKPIDLRAYA